MPKPNFGGAKKPKERQNGPKRKAMLKTPGFREGMRYETRYKAEEAARKVAQKKINSLLVFLIEKMPKHANVSTVSRFVESIERGTNAKKIYANMDKIKNALIIARGAKDLAAVEKELRAYPGTTPLTAHSIWELEQIRREQVQKPFKGKTVLLKKLKAFIRKEEAAKQAKAEKKRLEKEAKKVKAFKATLKKQGFSNKEIQARAKKYNESLRKEWAATKRRAEKKRRMQRRLAK